MEVIGLINSLHFDIDDSQLGKLVQVNIWWDKVLLTPIDNKAYLPQFIGSMRYELEQLVSKQINPDGFFLNLGPTTDDCSSRIQIKGDSASVTFELEESVVHLVTIQIAELISTYSKTIDKLEQLNV